MIKCKNVIGGGTTTDFSAKINCTLLVLEMTDYKSGIHSLKRDGDMRKEFVNLYNDDPATVNITIYLVDDSTPEGKFIIWKQREGLDDFYTPEPGKLVMICGEIKIPPHCTDLSTCDGWFIKVV